MHSEWLRLVRRFDPAASRWLHGGADGCLRPYTLSPIIAADNRRDVEMRLRTGGRAWFRLTALTPRMTDLLSRLIAQGALGTWIIEGTRLYVRKYFNRSEEHNWAGTASVADLIDRAVAAMASNPDRVLFELLTPTAFTLGSSFGWGSRSYSFPDQELVFQSLRNRLLAHSPEHRHLFANFGLLSATIALGRFDLRTHVIALRRHQRLRSGAVGAIEFLVNPEISFDDRLALFLLSGYSFFSGIGGGTSLGFGQARSIRTWSEWESPTFQRRTSLSAIHDSPPASQVSCF